MSALIEPLENRRFLSASPVHAQFLQAPNFIAQQQNYLAASATHDQSVVVSNVATIDWGDRSAKEAIPVFGVEPTEADVNPSHVYMKPGVYKARITFYQGDKIAARLTRRIRVAQTSPGGVTLSARTGQPLTAVYGTLVTDRPITNATLYFGDGTQGLGVVTQLSANTYSITSSHTYTKPGIYSVQVMGNGVFYPPGFPRPLTAQEPTVDAFSSVRVTGQTVSPVLPDVTLTSIIAPTITFGSDFPKVATATGLPNDGYEQVYAILDWNDTPIPGIITFNPDGTATISTLPPSTMTPVTMNFTLKVFINDHADGTQNTLLGTLSGSAQVDPGPTPGVSFGQHSIGSNPVQV